MLDTTAFSRSKLNSNKRIFVKSTHVKLITGNDHFQLTDHHEYFPQKVPTSRKFSHLRASFNV